MKYSLLMQLLSTSHKQIHQKKTFKITSLNNGGNVQILNKKLVKKTWHKEEITNFFPILLKHKIATGTFKTISPKEVEKLKPYNEVIRSIKIATPVKPLDNRLAGSTKTLIAYVCKKEDAITDTIVIRYRNQSLFFIILISLIFQLIPY